MRLGVKAGRLQVVPVWVLLLRRQPDGRTQDVVGDAKRVDQRHRHAAQLAAQSFHQPLDGLGLLSLGEMGRADTAGICVGVGLARMTA